MKILRYFIAIIIIGIIEIKYNMNLQGYSIVLICIIGTVYSCEFDYSKIVNVFNDIQGKMDYMHGSFLDLMKNGGIFFGVILIHFVKLEYLKFLGQGYQSQQGQVSYLTCKSYKIAFREFFFIIC